MKTLPSSQEAHQRLRILVEALPKVALHQTVDDIMETGLDLCRDLLGPGLVALALVSNGNELVPVAHLGLETRLCARLRIGPSITCSGHIPEQCTLYDRPETVTTVLEWFLPEGRSALCTAMGRRPPARLLWVPLMGERGRLGGLVLLARARGPMLDVDGLSLLRGVSTLLSLAVERLDLRRKVEQSTEMKTDIISVLSHQMRTPLASVKGYATALLLQGKSYDEATWHEFLQAIDEEADKLSDMIGTILESTAMEAGLFTIERQPLLLPRLAQRLARDVRGRASHHRIVVSFPQPFPIVSADEAHIAQVLHNLLDNAVKYSPDGGLVVVRGEVQDNQVVISVADQGVGIAPEHLNRLFERFFRIKGNLRRPVSGTGLGLPIARAIVEAHGGAIWAESTLREGSAFYFTLPLEQRLEEDEP